MSRLILKTLLVCCLSIPTALLGQDESPERSWEELNKVRTESYERLREIQKTVSDATPDEQVKLSEEYARIVIRMQKEIVPELAKLVPGRLAEAPKDTESLEIGSEIMRFSYQRNDFTLAKKMAVALLKANPKDALAANISAVCSFADHDFVEANRLLTAASQRGELMQGVGAEFLDSSKLYIDYWKQEQEIRAKEAEATGDAQLPRVLMKTSKGDMLLELFENQAPNTVANFISLVEKEFYNGLRFHRVIPGFMAQGGDPLSRDENAVAGSGGPGYRIKCEVFRQDARRHFSGTLSMAHAGVDTGGSQFFITHLPTPHLDKDIGATAHTVFGRVVEGLDIVRALQPNDEIISAEVVRKRSHEYKPETFPEVEPPL